MKKTITAAFLAFAAFAPMAAAQLTPDRTYYGINRAVPMQVAKPDGSEGEARIELYEVGKEGAVAQAPVAAGGVNLASLFPQLWTTTAPTLQYAQLVVGDTKVGAPVVLQPMVTLPIARIDPRDPQQATVIWPESPSVYSGVRAYVDKVVVLDTSAGEIRVLMRPDAAPNTVWNFRQLVDGGFYSEVIFHRVVAKLANGEPFVVQVGDPTGTGMGGPGYYIDLERSTLPHDFGVISMARSGDPNSNGSQVFLCLSRAGTSFLDGRYTAFGQTIAGADAITTIAATPVGAQDRPVNPPAIKSAKLVDAPPYGDAAREPVTAPSAAPKER